MPSVISSRQPGAASISWRKARLRSTSSTGAREAELQRQVLAERGKGVDAHGRDARVDFAAGVAGGRAAGPEQRRDLLVAPDLDEQHAAAAGRGRDPQRGGHGRLARCRPCP